MIRTFFQQTGIPLLILCTVASGLPIAPASAQAEASVSTSVTPKRIALAGADLSANGAGIQAAIKSRLQNEPYTLLEMSGTQLADTNAINTSNIDLLVWAGADTYPVESVPAVTSYLKQGGDLLALGAPPFSKPTMWIDGRWQSRSEIDTALKLEQPTVFMNFESADQMTGWTRSTNDPSVAGNVTFPQVDGTTVMQFDTANFTNYDTYLHTLAPLPADDSAIVFRAMGGPVTRRLVFELREADNSRWIAATDLTADWQTYVLHPTDFQCWSCTNRGGTGDYVKLSNVKAVNLGLALSHANLDPGAQRFYMDDIGWVRDPLAGKGVSKFDIIDGLTPDWKYYPISGHPVVHASVYQTVLPEPQGLTLDRIDGSVYPRSLGTGYNKLRTQRFIPLLETYDTAGTRSGYAAWMMVNSGQNYIFNRDNPVKKVDPPYRGSVTAVFAVSDPTAYQQAELTEAVVRTIKRMLNPTYLLEGGTEKFAYVAGPNDVKLGASVASLSTGTAPTTEVEWQVLRQDGSLLFTKKSTPVSNPVSRPGGSYFTAETLWTDDLAPGVYRVVTLLKQDQEVIDKLEHELNVWAPKPESSRQFVKTVQEADGVHFELGGQPWYAFGVNYMPAMGLAQENTSLYEFYYSPASYDPVYIDEDLKRIRGLGFNMVSVFLYYDDLASMNLLDFLVRAEKYGLKVNLGIKNIAAPRRFAASQIQDILTAYKLPDNDTLFAYDIAWEHEWGRYAANSADSFNADGRVIFDTDWERWVTDQYGSVSAAEADWGVSIPRKNADQQVTGPSDSQLANDGPWRRMVAAYRRFADDYTARIHTDAADAIRAMDPHHLVSFRMNMAGDPTASPDRMPYDLKGLASSMDFIGPEAYGRKLYGDITEAGMFTADTSRYAAPNKPMVWTEVGYSVWNRDSKSMFSDNTALYQNQKTFLEQFYDMVNRSRVDGVVLWWYAGGFRYNENSDYGILNPDGSDRPVTPVIRHYAALLSAGRAAAPVPKPVQAFTIDREASSLGWKAVYSQLKDSYWSAVAGGYQTVLTDAARGTTSADTPLVAVGGTMYNGSNPPKYLNGFLKKTELSLGDGRWFEVKDGMKITVPTGSPLRMRTRLVNTESATWLAPNLHHSVTGDVYLASTPESGLPVRLPILDDTAYQEETEVGDVLLIPAVNAKVSLALRLEAANRMVFGSKFRFTVEPGAVTIPYVSVPVSAADSLNGWYGVNSTLSLDSTDKTEGTASIQGIYGSGTPVQVEIAKRFPVSFRTGATGGTASKTSNGTLELDLYLSDVTKLTSAGRIQFSSLQVDQNEYVWNLKALVPNLKNGWNHLTLRLDQAQVNGYPDPGSLKVFRLITPLTATPETVKVDNLWLRNPAALTEKPSASPGSASIVPYTTDDAPEGWTNTAVTVTLSVYEPLAGVTKTVYSVDGAPFRPGRTVRIDGEGVHTLRYYSIGLGGNREPVRVTSVRIDRTPPVVSLAAPSSGTVQAAKSTSISVFVEDMLSGPGALEVRLDQAREPEHFTIEPFFLSPGMHILTVHAGDQAGNETNRTFPLEVRMELADLRPLLEQSAAQGLVKQQGTLSSLLSKVEEALILPDPRDALTALERELHAQSGKHIDADFARRLTNEILPYLIQHAETES